MDGEQGERGQKEGTFSEGREAGFPSGKVPLGTDSEITQPPRLNAHLVRLERWRLQSIARRVIPEDRISYCKRAVIPPERGGKGLQVWKSEKCAHYRGLITCGSVWVCPICAAKISEGRRVELIQANARWKAQGGGLGMVSLTVPHYEYQPLAQVLEGFGRSRRLMKNRKSYKAFARDIHLVGSVRALEVTYGGNGWHVHSHDILYLGPGYPDGIESSEFRVLDMWQKACGSAGMDRPNDRGCRIHDGSYASKYATKWGLESEVTKGHIKAGRDGNLSPWDMLRAIGKDDEQWLKRFQEFAHCFQGRHQLQWSKGLRDLLGLGSEVSDADLAEKDDEGGEFLGFLGREHWRVILKEEKRGELLEAAFKEGWPGVLAFIRELLGRRELGQEG